MHVAFLYNAASQDPGLKAEEPDPARSPVVAALRRLGHRSTCIACTLDLSVVASRLERLRPDVAFNRVESLGGSDAMMAAIPLLLETMQIPYTGCSAEGLTATASKLGVKHRLVRAGLSTPAWITADGACHGCGRRDSLAADWKSKYIIKSVHEHSSFQMDDSSVLEGADVQRIVHVLQRREAESRRPFFAEEFIDGREFNLSILGDKPQVFPPAEIDFSTFPEGKARIVSHAAKIDATSFEYHHTPRRFDFLPRDTALIRRLIELAADCARVFNLNGYSRIDFRCDADERPWILEINSNPCVSPSSGFPAALAQAGYNYEQGIQRLLDDALERSAVTARLADAVDRGRSTAAAAPSIL